MAYVCKYLHTVIKQLSDLQVCAIQGLTVKELLPVLGAPTQLCSYCLTRPRGLLPVPSSSHPFGISPIPHLCSLLPLYLDSRLWRRCHSASLGNSVHLHIYRWLLTILANQLQ